MSKTCQLFSGSSGNVIYISAPAGGILVDVGVAAKSCESALKDRGINPSEIRAVFITHEHVDHVKGLRIFTQHYKVPVYAKDDVLEAIISSGGIAPGTPVNGMPPKLEFEDILIESFENSHDAAACIGYKFNMPDGRNIAVCTDTGYITDSARVALKDIDLIYLESNYEQSMLENGPYPFYLKERIKSKKGHLSNKDADEFACELLEGGTTHFVLSHLSRKNNTPDVAAGGIISYFSEKGAKRGVDYRLYVSKPVNDGGMITL